MMSDLISINIDNQEIEVPKGTLVVDAAKHLGNDIPVFCYHPKMDPVGMCRMCLVEVGQLNRDLDTDDVVLDETGEMRINWMPQLQTACTMPVKADMQIRTSTAKVVDARKSVLELLLTSHPLDCPVCDKGGECSLQNLTMQHGPGVSRFLFEEKMLLDKRVPLGDLIYLDQERCIQCARCTRFQEEIVDDPVIGFDERGRALQIVTFSDPGFDSYFSGNTTDLCPVGALTTADFRFGARPWELQNSASICPHCSVGCNIHLNTRRSGKRGDWVVKRVMPRQNEQVNELWICDKGRFGHHFASSPERITVPLVRKNNKLVECTWDETLNLVAQKLKSSNGSVAGLASDRLSNEDLFTFRRLVEGVGGCVSQWPGHMGGGELVKQVGIGVGTNLSRVGTGTVILVVACDLEEEAPILWLRVKQAATKKGATLDKGQATLIVANARQTKTDRCATQQIRYSCGDEARTILALAHAVSGKKAGVTASIAAQTNENGLGQLGQSLAEAGRSIAAADNLIILYGSEGLDYVGSSALAQACANLLIVTGHIGKPNNGLVPVWPHNNTQGAWDMGVCPSEKPTNEFISDAKTLLLAGSDPVGDGSTLPTDSFTVLVELFHTATAHQADVVLPAQAFTEREGTYTNGERRVQRFYPAMPVKGQCRADWQIFSQIGELLDLGKCPRHSSDVMLEITQEVTQYDGMSYRNLAQVEKQWPDVGGEDLYYGGTAFDNSTGLGVQYHTLAEQGRAMEVGVVHPAVADTGALIALPTTRLYDRGTIFVRSDVMHPRLPGPIVELNSVDAAKLELVDGDDVDIEINGRETVLVARVGNRAPEGVILIPQSLGGPVLTCSQSVKVKKRE